MRQTACLALLGLALAQAAAAQSPQQFLPREPDTRANPAREVTPPKPQAPVAPVVAPARGVFVLRRVVLDGASAVPSAELAPIWADLIGQKITLATLDKVASGISAAYRARGYVLSQAAVPNQAVTDGTVHIQVIEGFIDRVGVQGGAPNQQAFARQLFGPVAADRPLAIGTLERAVLLSRDTFGGEVETVLEPAPATFGAADLTVEMTPDPWRGFATADNRGSRLYADGVTASAGASAFNLLGLNEQIDLLVSGAPDGSLGYGQIRMETPIAGLIGTRLDGARLVLEGDTSRADPDLAKSGSPQDLDVITHQSDLRAGIFVPFIRSRSQNLFGRLSLDWQDSESDTDFAGVSEPSTDKLTVLEARVSWDLADAFGGVNQVDATLRQGLPGQSSIGAGGPAAGQANFTSLALTLSRLQHLGDGPWSLYAEAIGQFASTILPNSERFALGDATIGRGFAPGNTTGDLGYGGRLELRRALSLTSGPRAVELYAYGDYGSAYDRSLARDGERWESLGSAGIGAQIDLADWLTITPEIAQQLVGTATDTTNTAHQTRFYIGAIARF